ncbi:hypothetical protein AB1Y20_001790 [Prymnesium parvum]|uniref:Uncharacterized protein n=1 Tax=Prymnesium parvum TaxID=97485 RepID=A0AB34KAI6_PRYPA
MMRASVAALLLLLLRPASPHATGADPRPPATPTAWARRPSLEGVLERCSRGAHAMRSACGRAALAPRAAARASASGLHSLAVGLGKVVEAGADSEQPRAWMALVAGAACAALSLVAAAACVTLAACELAARAGKHAALCVVEQASASAQLGGSLSSLQMRVHEGMRSLVEATEPTDDLDGFASEEEDPDDRGDAELTDPESSEERTDDDDSPWSPADPSPSRWPALPDSSSGSEYDDEEQTEQSQPEVWPRLNVPRGGAHKHRMTTILPGVHVYV